MRAIQLRRMIYAKRQFCKVLFVEIETLKKERERLNFTISHHRGMNLDTGSLEPISIYVKFCDIGYRSLPDC